MIFNKLIPELVISSLAASRSFYVDVLGFKFEYGREGFAFLSYEGSQLMLEERHPKSWITGPLEAPFGRGINFQIETSDAKKLLGRIERAGIKLTVPLADNWYFVGDKESGSREFLVQDPDGYLLRFSEFLGER